MSNDVRIVLAGAAKVAHDQMLSEARADGKTSINSSKLINWIVSDYFERFFKSRKSRLCQEHFNSRKCVLEAMKIEDPEERRRVLQEAIKSLATVLKTPKSRKPKAVKAKIHDAHSSDENDLEVSS